MSSKSKIPKFISRIKFPHIKWPQFIGYTLALLLLIPALLNLHTAFYPEREQEAELLVFVLNSPFSPEAHHALGDYYAKQGNVRKSIREYKLAYSLGSRDVLGAYKEITMREKRIREEILYWEEQLKQKPDYRDGMLKLASLYYQVGSTQKTKKLLDQIKSIDPNYPPLTDLYKSLN